jgi:hypothetical protein
MDFEYTAEQSALLKALRQNAAELNTLGKQKRQAKSAADHHVLLNKAIQITSEAGWKLNGSDAVLGALAGSEMCSLNPSIGISVVMGYAACYILSKLNKNDTAITSGRIPALLFSTKTTKPKAGEAESALFGFEELSACNFEGAASGIVIDCTGFQSVAIITDLSRFGNLSIFDTCGTGFANVVGSFDVTSPTELTAKQSKEIRAILDLAFASFGTGVCRRTLELAKTNSQSEMVGGKSLGAHQQIRYSLADVLTQIQAAEWLLYRASWMLDADDQEFAALAKTARAFCCETASACVQTASRLVGGRDESIIADMRELSMLEWSLNHYYNPLVLARLGIAEDLLAQFEV